MKKHAKNFARTATTSPASSSRKIGIKIKSGQRSIAENRPNITSTITVKYPICLMVSFMRKSSHTPLGQKRSFPQIRFGHLRISLSIMPASRSLISLDVSDRSQIMHIEVARLMMV